MRRPAPAGPDRNPGARFADSGGARPVGAGGLPGATRGARSSLPLQRVRLRDDRGAGRDDRAPSLLAVGGPVGAGSVESRQAVRWTGPAPRVVKRGDGFWRAPALAEPATVGSRPPQAVALADRQGAVDVAADRRGRGHLALRPTGVGSTSCGRRRRLAGGSAELMAITRRTKKENLTPRR